MSFLSSVSRRSVLLSKQLSTNSSSIFRMGLSSKVTPVVSTKAPPAAASYSHAIKANGFIYVSGQIPFTLDGKPVEGDFQAQSEQVIKNVLGIVEDANSSLENIVKVNIFLADISNFGDFNEVYSKYFNVHKPARSCVAVKALPLGVPVEMEVIAVEK
ncbi:DEKNAAC105258 [Brettanomyces naardenensis]|uniref:DEKNAAC105258 n=1 Tax=Brettanomyces naardenensis TaxID=13370 RepID=A0A448YT52_BRENA|nr:DEKNAAC105258 [Brettanomyces naardenensis]